MGEAPNTGWCCCCCAVGTMEGWEGACLGENWTPGGLKGQRHENESFELDALNY